MRRPLGRFELAQALTDEASPLNAVVVVRLEPGLEDGDLRRALNVLRRRHPLLGVRLARAGRSWVFESTNTPEIPVATLPRESDEHWRTLAERELDTRFDAAAGPLLRLTVLEDDDGCDLVVTFLHVIMDATSGARVVHELLSLVADPALELERREPLPPIEERFPAPYQGFGRVGRTARFVARQLAAEAAYRWRMRGQRRPPVAPRARNRVLTFELPADVTRRLVRRGRRERVTLSSVLDAAALLAVAERLYGGRTLPLRSLAFPNLRPHLRPPVADEDLASCFVLMRLQTRVDPREDPWELARRLNAQTAAALKRGDKYAAALLAPHLMRSILRDGTQRMGHTAVSYTGPLPLADAYGDLRVTGLHAFVSNIPLGPEFTAQARLADRRLTWDVAYLETDFDREAAAAMAAEVRGILYSLAEEESP